ncbi:Long-chain-fatty-acid--CoA ligase [[Actinomadura] parvosata subsp. kistnae]|uniref:Acyl-CoA synthetase n=1 Tax=[Actinomadura] parvosata subsp. kistnae TaxID=1909395 RepID=A0A1V0A312_9ACTN|nr:long-chain fatty acid--CoA ligase [Nonomuraea sp. ATCC 55076]AQZ64594.1 long-chain fatty acid--CoA ligase [Nonomuraea sp. ATCC 55076]SPL99581.1 Long-chain-fatty-acid--CoA ligase [Actinomadura parvosata subsp. kistnae]
MSSIPSLLRDRIAASPDAEAYRVPSADGWTSLTWREVGERVRDLALALAELGSGPGTRVSILCSTRLEWILCDLAVLATGAATTTIYPSNTAAESAFVITDSGSTIVIAENDEQVAKLRSVQKELPGVTHVIVIDGTGSDDGWVITLGSLSGGAGDYDAMVDAIAQDDLATLIYTSGTTGRPKGVELTHDNWLYAAGAVREIDLISPSDLHFLWLPLSHSFGKLLEVVMIDIGVPTAIDGRIDRIADNLGVVRPTVMAAAPRVFEKIHNTVVANMRREGGLKLRIFSWARETGRRVVRARQRGTAIPVTTRAEYALADRLVFAKLRERFGGRIRFFISGAAPLNQEVAEFFDAAGLTILEGYGLTESSAGSFLNRPESVRFGTVGPPFPGTRVRIAEDGEILIGGRGVMRGYHGLPEETAEALEDGWLHTGDIGELDEAGRLRITDRKKELIKTSGGKYVAPTYLEGRIKAACPFVSHVFVHGDRRNYVTALVTLDMDVVTPWAQAESLPADPAELREHPRMRAEVEKAIKEVNAGEASYATVKKFAILAEDFSVETGELTASLKIKRKAVEERHGKILDSFYE